MKNINAVLKKSKLSAKERALIFISTQIEEEKTGKKVLDAKLIDAIKDKKAFINDRYIDTFNNHIKVWTKKVFVEGDIHAMYSKAALTLEALNVLAFTIVKTSMASSQLRVILKKLQELQNNQDESTDACFDLGFYHSELLNPFLTLKTDPKSGKKIISLEENLKLIATAHIDNFRIFYRALLALQRVLKTVSEELGIDISYNVDPCIKVLKEKVSTYNRLIDAGLPDFEHIKSTLEDTLEDKDKVYADKKAIYLDLDELTYDEKVHLEILEIFEELLGKNFWENN